MLPFFVLFVITLGAETVYRIVTQTTFDCGTASIASGTALPEPVNTTNGLDNFLDSSLSTTRLELNTFAETASSVDANSSWYSRSEVKPTLSTTLNSSLASSRKPTSVLTLAPGSPVHSNMSLVDTGSSSANPPSSNGANIVKPLRFLNGVFVFF